jgi:cell division protein FtsB
VSASRRPNRPGSRSTGPGRTRAGRRPAPATGRTAAVKRVRVRPRRRLSRRAAVIALVLSALALAYAYPLRTYVEQRIEINRLEAEQSDQRDRIEALEAQRIKWDDPEYVKSQIRSRLLLTVPGEELILVVDEDDPDRRSRPGDEDADGEPLWYDELLATFEDADQLNQEDQ